MGQPGRRGGDDLLFGVEAGRELLGQEPQFFLRELRASNKAHAHASLAAPLLFQAGRAARATGSLSSDPRGASPSFFASSSHRLQAPQPHRRRASPSPPGGSRWWRSRARGRGGGDGDGDAPSALGARASFATAAAAPAVEVAPERLRVARYEAGVRAGLESGSGLPRGAQLGMKTIFWRSL